MSLPTTALTPDVLDRAAVLDTAAISDALDSLSLVGHLSGLAARVPGMRAVGPAYTVTYRPIGERSGFHNAANYLDEVPAGAVILIDNAGSIEYTNWGGLLTTVAQRRNVAGTLVHGSARDISEIRESRYPLFSTGVSMVSGKNRVELDSVGRSVTIGQVTVRAGDLLVADDNGVLVVAAERAIEVINRAEAVERTEARIAAAILSGHRLDQARSEFGYARPWDDHGSTQ